MSLYKKIKDEIDGNPGLYGLLTDQQTADELNAIDKVQARKEISGSELFGYTDQIEYNALSDAKKSHWLGLCSIDVITQDAVPILQDIFNSGSATWANIQKTETVSRASQLGLPPISIGDVTNARAQ